MQQISTWDVKCFLCLQSQFYPQTALPPLWHSLYSSSPLSLHSTISVIPGSLPWHEKKPSSKKPPVIKHCFFFTAGWKQNWQNECICLLELLLSFPPVQLQQHITGYLGVTDVFGAGLVPGEGTGCRPYGAIGGWRWWLSLVISV